MYFTMFNVCSIIRCDSGCEELPTIMSGGLKWVMQAILRSEGGARGGAVKKDFLQMAQGSEYCCTIFGDRTCTNILMGSSMGGGRDEKYSWSHDGVHKTILTFKRADKKFSAISRYFNLPPLPQVIIIDHSLSV